ncbi:MAG TPA: hypothetical protein QGH18_05345, partial [Arenicellales bacterium]|nr:hypothetical protein [Arenicellales bacterium]
MTPTRPHVREPGLWQTDPFLERYTVPGAGAIVFKLFPDDVLAVTDPEGAQVGEIGAFAPDG